MTFEGRRGLVRVAFWLWASALFVGTHWPALTLPGTGRPDLFIHAGIFGLWTLLLLACGYFGPPLSWGNIGAVLLIAPAYAGLDEALQAIPWVRRHAALDDWACDVLGILIACGVAAVLRVVRPPAVDTLSPRGT